MPKKEGLVVTEGNGNMYGGHARRKHIFFTTQLQKLFLLSGRSLEGCGVGISQPRVEVFCKISHGRTLQIRCITFRQQKKQD